MYFLLQVEVITIVMNLFDEEEILKSYIRSERYEAAEVATREAAIKKAKLMLKRERITIEEMSEFFPELTDEDVKEIEVEVMQLK